MKVANQMLKIYALCLCLFAPEVLIGKLVQKDSLPFMMSYFFSLIECNGEDEIEVTMMDTPLHWTISYLRREIDYKGINVGDKVTLVPGDSVKFLSGCAVMTVTVTNGVYRQGTVKMPREFADSAHLVIFEGNGFRLPGNGEAVNAHQLFIYDIASHKVFDVEHGLFERFNLPFHALWRDWDDYLEHFSGNRKIDFAGFCCQHAKFLREKAEESQTLREFCSGLPDDVPRVVCYWAEHYKTNFVLVKKKGTAFDVLGVAELQRGGQFGTYVFDECGRLRWMGDNFQNDKRREFKYEFNDAGGICRFVELDGQGRELRWRDRLFKDGKMLEPDARKAFLAEAETVFRPLMESWTNNCYAIVPNIPPPSPDDVRRMAIAKSNLTKWEQKVQDKCAKINAIRRDAGQPELTELEKRMIVRGEILGLGRKRFEELRHESTGCLETTAFDKAIDLERARLSYLSDKMSVYNDLTSRTLVARPETLRELLDVKFPPRGDLPLLLEGEKDIRDQWGKDYRYHAEFVTVKTSGMKWPVIISAGPDGVFDTLDDISSLDEFKMKGIEFE